MVECFRVKDHECSKRRGAVLQRMMMVAVLMIFIAGCATSSGSTSLTSQLQMKVGELERQVEVKDQQIGDLETQIKDLSYEVDRLKSSGRRQAAEVEVSRPVTAVRKEGIIRVDASTQDVQRALKNAGFYTAAIDGKIGQGTKDAISSFQKDKGLKADGIVGAQTWTELRTYLE